MAELRETLHYFPRSASGIYWNSSGTGSSGDSNNILVFDNGRVQRITFEKKSLFNLFGCNDFEGFNKKSKDRKVYLSIKYISSREQTSSAPTFKIGLYSNATFRKLTSDNWDKTYKYESDSDYKFSANTVVRYDITDLFNNKIGILSDEFYLWTGYSSSYGMDGKFYGTRGIGDSQENNIHIEIEYTKENYTPTITSVIIDDTNFYKQQKNSDVPFILSFSMPSYETLPGSMYEIKNGEEILKFNENHFKLKYSIGSISESPEIINLKCAPKDEKGYEYIFLGNDMKIPGDIFFKNIINEGKPATGRSDIKYDLYLYIYFEFDTYSELSAPYLYRFTPSAIPLSLSPKGNGVSIGALTNLGIENDDAKSARFECHYPIVIFADSEEIPKSYDGDAPKGTGINGQLFFKLSDTTGSGWKQLIPYMYYEDTTTTTNESVTETTSESE